MRGAYSHGPESPFHVGIIPAHAGSMGRVLLTFHGRAGSSPRMRGASRFENQSLANARDHPRVCGEHQSLLSILSTLVGSTPRMRGAHELREQVRVHRGIIPAYAGSTKRRHGAQRQRQDHPRVCGEHSSSSGRFGIQTGSSPRMRGAQVRGGRYRRVQGIIPAHAGSTD